MHKATRKAHRPDEFLYGVPNRHLTHEEYAALDAEAREAIVTSGLWDVRQDRETKAAAATSAGKDDG